MNEIKKTYRLLPSMNSEPLRFVCEVEFRIKYENNSIGKAKYKTFEFFEETDAIRFLLLMKKINESTDITSLKQSMEFSEFFVMSDHKNDIIHIRKYHFTWPVENKKSLIFSKIVDIWKQVDGTRTYLKFVSIQEEDIIK